MSSSSSSHRISGTLTRRREFLPELASDELRTQFSHPTDVFSVLLLLGGDVIARALAQLAGGMVTPVAVSFGGGFVAAFVCQDTPLIVVSYR